MKRTAPILTILTLAALLFPVTAFAQVPAGCVLFQASGVQDGSGTGQLLGTGTETIKPAVNYTTACVTPRAGRKRGIYNARESWRIRDSDA